MYELVGETRECWTLFTERFLMLPFRLIDLMTLPKKGRFLLVFVSSSTSTISSRLPEIALLTSGPASCKVLSPA